MRSFEWVDHDGAEDAVNPVVDFAEEPDRFVINNGLYTYEVNKSDIKSWEFKELQD